MASVTVRNIPDQALKRLHERAAVDRRSLNSEILVLLEQAVGLLPDGLDPCQHEGLTPSVQIQRWEELCGRWHDDREWQTIADEIVAHRTAGREVVL